uniref:Uncharacterized protein n=1 Tax=Ditylenchus dipsaci TaxID=166011 RepID=A0A915D5F1_9BILA
MLPTETHCDIITFADLKTCSSLVLMSSRTGGHFITRLDAERRRKLSMTQLQRFLTQLSVRIAVLEEAQKTNETPGSKRILDWCAYTAKVMLEELGKIDIPVGPDLIEIPEEDPADAALVVPAVVAPAVPAVNAPAVPAVVAPAMPAVVAPAVPAVVAPAMPAVVAPAVPDIGAPPCLVSLLPLCLLLLLPPCLLSLLPPCLTSVLRRAWCRCSRCLLLLLPPCLLSLLPPCLLSLLPLCLLLLLRLWMILASVLQPLRYRLRSQSNRDMKKQLLASPKTKAIKS